MQILNIYNNSIIKTVLVTNLNRKKTARETETKVGRFGQKRHRRIKTKLAWWT